MAAHKQSCLPRTAVVGLRGETCWRIKRRHEALLLHKQSWLLSCHRHSCPLPEALYTCVTPCDDVRHPLPPNPRWVRTLHDSSCAGNSPPPTAYHNLFGCLYKCTGACQSPSLQLGLHFISLLIFQFSCSVDSRLSAGSEQVIDMLQKKKS